MPLTLVNFNSTSTGIYVESLLAAKHGQDFIKDEKLIHFIYIGTGPKSIDDEAIRLREAGSTCKFLFFLYFFLSCYIFLFESLRFSSLSFSTARLILQLLFHLIYPLRSLSLPLSFSVFFSIFINSFSNQFQSYLFISHLSTEDLSVPFFFIKIIFLKK